MMSRNWAVVAVALSSIAVSAAPAAQAADPSAAREWQQVGTGITGGVSGLAVIENGANEGEPVDLVMVRDNKKPGENRVATVRYRHASPPVVRELPWRGLEEPKDLEAVDAVPGQPGDFVALSSDGTAYHFTLDPDAAMVWGSSPVPGRAPGDNYESFALTRQHGRTVAVWATRGSSDAQPAKVRAAVYDPNSGAFGPASGPVLFSVPDPLPVDGQEVRHASDIKIHEDGTVLLTAASDPNINSGPFASAVYRAGKVTSDTAGRIGLQLLPKDRLTALASFSKEVDNRKIEAVACPGNGGPGIVGTDDEDHGGSLLTLDICPNPKN
ncbi:hypothetical protein GCM10010387_63060 [Streptomyces inusitatus]|uniref:Secreted protein n=1 Tax=Streptomyces inusitatus TaxID=68221 RepID=A0A918V256_9ACTN|nr:hypothetical protein [Streptomyces inusitatus]GGZ60768.1 hypothetical protein GCM10010387_63060 [Streptomyces inusitatus]